MSSTYEGPYTPTVMRSTRVIGAKTEVVWLPGVRGGDGKLVAWVPLGMKKERAEKVAAEMVAEREVLHG